ncbi:hypothetical protein Tco_1517542 [Tanacetum coccineum]
MTVSKNSSSLHDVSDSAGILESMQKMSKYIIQTHRMDWRSYYDNGWDPLYTVWEKLGNGSTYCPAFSYTFDHRLLMSDMDRLLDDLSYIPPNNEHNEPTQGRYCQEHTAKDMIWHANGSVTGPGCVLMVSIRSATLSDVQHVAGDIDNIQSASVVMYERKTAGFMGQRKVLRLRIVSGQNFQLSRMRGCYGPINDFLPRSDCWVEWARRFLRKPHKWRSSREFNGDTDHRDPPKEYPRDVILAQHARLLTRVPGKHPNMGEDPVKPQAAYSFTPENQKKFCQYIKGVKLPDGFGSCFKHKVTDNDTNITGLKSHDCHIMMQRLLPYGLQNYLPDNIAKPIIELSSLFKQLCSATLMEDDMLKASVKVVEILCELERIYPPAFFDIMIHLPIHLALEALEGGPIHPRWMFPFERFMKKLKGYVRNKAKPEGSIAEGYVAEEALTLSSHYFRDVTTKFNRLERNVDPPPPTCQFQAFRSVCNTIGLRSFPPFGAKEFNKARWYVLHNSPEIDTYRAQFQSLFREKNKLEKFFRWFRTLICERHANNLQDPEVSTTSELFALANGPSRTPMSVNACVVDGVRYVVQSRDERRTTQNSGICAPGPDGEMSYGQLQEILEFKYLSFKVALFRVKWFDTRNNGRVKKLTFRNGMTQIIGSVDLHIDGESTEVDAPPDIIDVPGEDDDISDDEDPLPHDLADSDVEDLINDDDVWLTVDEHMAGDGGGGENDVGNPRGTFRDRHVLSSAHLHTVNGVFQDPEALRMYDRMRELEATGEHTTAEINAMVRGGKLRGHIPGVGPVMPGYVRSRLSYTAPVDRSRDVDFMMSLMRSDNRFADAFARYDSGGASGSGGSRARDSEGGEDGDDTGGEDGGDDTS